jgi:protein CpxP
MISGKRTRFAKIAVMLSIAALTACAGIAQADEGGWDGEQGVKPRQQNFRKVIKRLGLTDAQKAQAKEIFQGNKDGMKVLFASLQTERKNLRSLIQADTVDEAAIRAETAKMAAIQADLNVNRAKTGAQFRATLTPSQLAQLKIIQQEQAKKRVRVPPPVE